MTPARRLPLPPRRNVGGRPAGAVGEVARAVLCQAAAAPGTARELSRRALVGDRVGKYTVSRLVGAGLLVRVMDTRPAVFAAKDCAGVCLLDARPGDAGAVFGALAALFSLPLSGGLQELETA